MFYKLKDKSLTYEDIHIDDEGNTWFLNALDEAQLKAFGYAKVIEGAQPQDIKATQEIKRVENFDASKNIYTIEYKVVDKDLESLKQDKIEQIDMDRDAAIESGVSFKNKIFQSAEKDRNLLTSTISLFSLQKAVPEGFVWISSDNVQVPFTLEELIQLGSLMASSVQANTLKARELKDKVLAAKSIDEIEKIEFK